MCIPTLTKLIVLHPVFYFFNFIQQVKMTGMYAHILLAPCDIH